jgi:hypothetical protein
VQVICNASGKLCDAYELQQGLFKGVVPDWLRLLLTKRRVTPMITDKGAYVYGSANGVITSKIASWGDYLVLYPDGNSIAAVARADMMAKYSLPMQATATSGGAPGARGAAQAGAAAAAARLVQRNALSAAIAAYVGEYSYEADTPHIPSEFERDLIQDALHGFLQQHAGAIAAAEQ